MRWDIWLAYFAACWAIAISPGSGALLSISHGLAYGLRRASTTIMGLQAGVLVVLLVAGGGLGALLLASGRAFLVIKTAGALYLIYLGVQQWRAKVTTSAAGVDDAPQVVPMSAKRRFITGMLTNLTNPKGIVFMVAVLPQFIDPARPLATQLAVMALTMCCVDMIVMHSYALLGSRAQRLMRNARALRWQNRIFGSVLVAMGTALFFVRRHHPAS